MDTSQQQSFATDTATLVLYDEESLRLHFEDECDWWTGDGDLDREEQAERLAYINTAVDGLFSLTVSPAANMAQDGTLLKESVLAAPTGRVYYGPGECLPGEGVTFFDELPKVELRPGRYRVRIFPAEAPGVQQAYLVELSPL